MLVFDKLLQKLFQGLKVCPTMRKGIQTSTFSLSSPPLYICSIAQFIKSTNNMAAGRKELETVPSNIQK
ncbi:hypothetical protein A3F01_00655 [Candidatus Woesebacteria bacterium RIFCSPHIGHO2_12_FULL_38_11]|nr:MAG: hypothetical protein A3F01_00655 [Candidatus Woesebacteria bacterium RIFCSPHIGHO2_12_FULL_38_11]